jgi:hypothetical protein
MRYALIAVLVLLSLAAGHAPPKIELAPRT